MGFSTGKYATVWQVDVISERMTKVRISTSRKNKDGEYEQDFSGFVAFVGNAAKPAANLRPQKDGQKGDRIKLGDVEVTTKYDKAAKKEYVNYTAFSFEMADGSGGSAKTESKPAKKEVDDVEPDESDLPF